MDIQIEAGGGVRMTARCKCGTLNSSLRLTAMAANNPKQRASAWHQCLEAIRAHERRHGIG